MVTTGFRTSAARAAAGSRPAPTSTGLHLAATARSRRASTRSSTCGRTYRRRTSRRSRPSRTAVRRPRDRRPPTTQARQPSRRRRAASPARDYAGRCKRSLVTPPHADQLPAGAGVRQPLWERRRREPPTTGSWKDEAGAPLGAVEPASAKSDESRATESWGREDRHRNACTCRMRRELAQRPVRCIARQHRRQCYAHRHAHYHGVCGRDANATFALRLRRKGKHARDRNEQPGSHAGNTPCCGTGFRLVRCAWTLALPRPVMRT